MWRSEGRVTAADSNAPSAQCHIPDMPSCWGNPHWKRLPQRSLLVCMVRSRRSNPKNWSKHTEREWWKEGTDLLQNFLYMSCHSSCRTAVRRRVTGASTIWFLIMQLNQPCNAKQKNFSDRAYQPHQPQPHSPLLSTANNRHCVSVPPGGLDIIGRRPRDAAKDRFRMRHLAVGRLHQEKTTGSWDSDQSQEALSSKAASWH